MAILPVGIQKYFHSVYSHKLTRSALSILSDSVKLVKVRSNAIDVKADTQLSPTSSKNRSMLNESHGSRASNPKSSL